MEEHPGGEKVFQEEVEIVLKRHPAVNDAVVLGVPDAARSVPLLVQERITDVLIGHGHFQAIADRAMPDLAPTLRRAVLSGTKIPPRL